MNIFYISLDRILDTKLSYKIKQMKEISKLAISLFDDLYSDIRI